VAKPLHRFVVRHPRQRQFHVQIENLLRQPRHQPIDHHNHILALDKRHLHIELREFRLPVGA
jgi:hypothetical protein